MKIRQAICLLLALVTLGCGVNRYELYQRLPEQDKELFDRSKQFMTDRQQERFLLLKESGARAKFVEDLHIQDRLSKFPPYVQDAIMAGRIVPGMSVEAVLLSWGRPHEIDRRDVDGVPAECWLYLRREQDGRSVDKKVYILRGQVTEVE
jgi:hypothetical protein